MLDLLIQNGLLYDGTGADAYRADIGVAGDRIDKVGPPEEIFTREYIAKLYHMEPGKYDPCFATLDFVP